MSWTPSSKALTLAVLLALSLVAVGSVSAISVSDDAEFNESRVGETVETTVVIEDPFQDHPDEWTLQGETELENVSWVVTTYRQGDQIDESTYGGQEFTQDLHVDDNGDEVRVTVSGDTPTIDNYTYDPAETYTLWQVDSITGDSEETLNASENHHYTNDSKEARDAIDEAAGVINESGNPQEARDSLNSSISAYDNGNFGNAIDLAERATDEAEQAQQSQQRRQTLIYGAVAVVVLALLGGTIYYWQQNRQEYTKLQ